ncbi:hypothetical protein [Legionella maioricensis]|uniref:Uncharacterized protein n=1 Tax=Legionella maioricensis TaxID=2896528 RepID=A0A9X2CZC3_9GAMM|nr:hypothetical protein [Legionella maioricensis]MCL9683521.1 hypothetical protein [Legionella maioricensis]MCL9686820.1 hypothetical protein [Legionella maioricensis]
MVTITTFILGIISGYILNITAMKISFKQRTIDYKIKVYDSLIINWIQIRNHLIHFEQNGQSSGVNKWSELDRMYGQSQTYIGEAFLVSDNQQLLMDINDFNERFIRNNLSNLSESEINTHLDKHKEEGLRLISRMKDDVHQSTRFIPFRVSVTW